MILKKNFDLTESVIFDIAGQDGRGDLTTSIALQVAKRVGKKPHEIAVLIAEGLEGEKGIERIEVAGPGYINVYVQSAVLVSSLTQLRQMAEAKPIRPKEKPVIVDYSAPNIAKPLAIHHILSTVIGQVIVNLYRHEGYPVVAWNYLGDWGTQFGKLAVAYERWGAKPIDQYTIDELLEMYVRFHSEAEKDATLEVEGRKAFQKMEKGDKKLRAFWAAVVNITKDSLKDLYNRLQVSFDVDLGESFYEDKMEAVIEEGTQKKVITVGEAGALIVDFPEETKLPPYLIQKGDGSTLYSTRDLAQMKYRIDTYHPQAIFILTDVAQKLHFEQLEETCNMLGWKLPEFEHVLFGRMRFMDKSMSTRKGNVLKLEDVLDEAVSRAGQLIAEKESDISTQEKKDLQEMMGIGAVVYGILSQNRKMDMVFDWDKALAFEGNSAPYLQYTYARARSVLRKAGAEQIDTLSYDKDLTENERLLFHSLFLFPQTVEAARVERMPHRLSNYAYDLCQTFNSFYNTDSILSADGSTKELRLALTSLTAHILQIAAAILTLRVPERM